MTKDKIISLTERRVWKDLQEKIPLKAVDDERIEPADIYEFIGRIHSGEVKGTRELCVKCQRNNWEIMHFGGGDLMGKCLTSGCKGATFIRPNKMR